MENRQGLAAILRTLGTCDYQRDLVLIRSLIYEVLSLSTNGSNVKPALPAIVKFLAHPDPFVKRVAGEIISIHAEENQDISLLGINTLVQDCKDVNPVVRGISFRILGSLKTNAVCEVLNTSIVGGLSDKNGYVRRSAALASIGLNSLAPAAVVEGEIWDLLYYHLRDDDAATVAGCLCALEEVCAKEKGIVMSNKLGQYLINNIHNFSPTVQRIVLQFLLKFSPKTKDQMFDNLNHLDDNLAKAQCFAMVFCAYELFFHFTQDVPRVQKKLTASAWSSIKTNLSRERSEEVISAAIHYITSVKFSLENCSADFSKFVCRDDDSLYLTHHKINILTKMTTPDNADKIFSEYLSCVRTMSLNDIKYLMQKVSHLLNENPDVCKACTDFVKNLMATEKSSIISEVIKILPSVTLDDPDHWKDVLTLMEEKFPLITSLETKIAMLQMIKTYASKMENAPEVLEKMFLELQSPGDVFPEEKMKERDDNLYGNIFKIHLLGAMVQVFLLRPALIQPILAKHMELCIRDSDHVVRDKALIYYGFLSSKAEQDV